MHKFLRFGVLAATAAVIASMLPLAPTVVSIVTGVDVEASASAVGGTLPAKWKSISSPGSGVTCAVSQSGQIWCWGRAEGPRGVAWVEDDGNPNTTGDGPATGTSMDPVRVGSASNWTKVEVGFDHACALNSLGEIWCWGDNSTGELGQGTTTQSRTPVKIYLPANGWTDVSVGRDITCGLRTNTLHCWGDNTQGRIFGSNFGALGNITMPRIADFGGVYQQVASISVGYRVTMILLDGSSLLSDGSSWHVLPIPSGRTWRQVSDLVYTGNMSGVGWNVDTAAGFTNTSFEICGIRSDQVAICFRPNNLDQPTQLGPFSDWITLGWRPDQPRQPICGLRGSVANPVVQCLSVYGREDLWATIGFRDQNTNGYNDTRPYPYTADSQSQVVGTQTGGAYRILYLYVSAGPLVVAEAGRLTFDAPAGITPVSLQGGFFIESVARDPSYLRWGRVWMLGNDGGLYVIGDKGRNERQDGRADNYPTAFARALVAAPTLSSVTGTGTVYVPTLGGKTVTLNGTYLTGITSVTIGGTDATSFTESDDGTTLQVVVPTGSLGAANIVVTNNAGSATLSSAVTYGTAPSAPTIGSASAGAGSATVTWSASGSAGTQPITSYVVTAAPGGQTCTWTSGALACVVSGLTNGVSYTFTVQGVSSVGGGLASGSSSAVIPYTFPSAPQIDSVSAGSTTIDVDWTAQSNGGSAITGYTAVTDPGGYTCATDAATTACTISGLSNGTPYNVSVYATNAGGDGAVAAWPVQVTPRTTPGSPRTVRLTASDRSLRASWLAPLSTGGAAITKYTATATPTGTTCEVAPPTLSCSLVGLTNGTDYSVTVVATNPAGDGSATSPVIGTPITTPGKPTFTTPDPGDGQVTLSWRAPSSNGGSAVTSYSVVGTPSGSCTTTGALTCVVSGLANGTSYSFVVTGANAAGIGSASTSTTATPRTKPGDPRNVGVANGVEQLTVSWAAPLDNGGSPVTGYRVTAQPGGVTCETAADGLACVLEALDNGTHYSVSVQAINAAGDGSSSDEIIGTPRTISEAPDSVEAAADNRSALVTWEAPTANGGAAIDSYRVSTNPSGGTCTTSETSCTVTGLTNGRSYVFMVSAHNEAGWSITASSLSTLIAVVPTQPKSVVATAGDGTIAITWQKPVSDGGSTVTSYNVYANEDLVCTWTRGSLACSASSLENGVAYSITVTALNVLGEGPPSQPMVATPGRVPARPTDVNALPLTGSAEVGWIAPEDDGGYAVTSYKVTASPGGRTCTATGEQDSCVVTGLTAGSSYTFAVVAANARGKSPAATSAAVRIVGPPGAGRGLYGVGGSGSITLYFSAPAITGGSTVNNYEVTCISRGQTVVKETNKTTVTVTGLAKRTNYSCSVVPQNQYGPGPAKSAPVTTK